MILIAFALLKQPLKFISRSAGICASCRSVKAAKMSFNFYLYIFINFVSVCARGRLLDFADMRDCHDGQRKTSVFRMFFKELR